MVDQKYLLDRFSYDPWTGILTRKVDGFVSKNPDPSTGYFRIRIAEKLYYVHRLIWCMQTGAFPVETLEHLDRNRTNNKWSNLKSISKADNALNKSKQTNNRSGITGVSFDSFSGKWRAEVQHRGVKYKLGRFTTIEEAGYACQVKRAELGFSATHGN